MKSISQTLWNRYQASKEGQETINLFKTLHTDEATPIDILAACKRFDAPYFTNIGPKEEKHALDYICWCMDICQLLLNTVEINDTEKRNQLYAQILANIYLFDGAEDEYREMWESPRQWQDVGFWEEFPQPPFKDALSGNLFLTMVLYSYFPQWFLPNFFPMQFDNLLQIAETYDLDLPMIPNELDYKGRNLYYLPILDALRELCERGGINDPAEQCAFICDQIAIANEELQRKRDNEPMPAVAGQAWLLVGKKNEYEKSMQSGYWQASPFTTKGDILMFYETSPVSALNAAWIATENGFCDPFGTFYSYTHLGNKIEVPAEKAITNSQFRTSEYFKHKGEKVLMTKDATPKLDDNKRPVIVHEKNFVAKNFQNCSGWEINRGDYAEIKRMLESNGFDTSLLPDLYQPKKIGSVEINSENDIYVKLITPLLNQMGWELGRDFEREVEFPAGRGTTHHPTDKRPDYCLRIKRREGQVVSADVIIEAKEHMKNDKEIKENFNQGLTYAKWGNAKVLVTCDDTQIRVYERDSKGQFSDRRFTRYLWADMENGDSYNALKNQLS